MSRLARNPAGVGLLQYRPRAVRLDGSSGTYISTPDQPAFAIGDLDVRWFGSMDNWVPASNQVLVAQFAAFGSGQRGWRLFVNTSGSIALEMTTDGSTLVTASNGVAGSLPARAVSGVRATWRASDGRTQFFTSPDGVTWTQSGTDKTIAIASIHDSTSPLEIGSRTVGADDRLIGSVRAVVLKDGIDGTTVANPDFRKASFGAKSLTDSVGNVWTLNGAAHIQAA